MAMKMRTLAIGALVLGSWAVPARAADPAKDVPGPIDSLQDLQDTGKMLFKLADENNDGQISQREAIDAGNLLVGGFFFRADANGDGTLSKEEIRAARENFLAQKPILRVILQRTKEQRGTQGTSPNPDMAQGILTLVDSNNDGQIQATELRQFVQSGVQGGFAAADTNRDGQLSPTEVNAAMVGTARAVAQAAFQRADTDGNGQLSQAEFDKALVEPANALFNVLDSNKDGQISTQEAQAAERILANQIRRLQVPEPANSPKHLMQSGRTPAEVAPVPNININARPGQPQGTPAPAPPR